MSYYVVSYVAAFVGGGLLGNSQKAPSIKPPEAPTPPPQQSKAPDANDVLSQMKGAGQGGGSPGVGSTFLTGSSGVDPNSLNLGKNTLLGG